MLFLRRRQAPTNETVGIESEHISSDKQRVSNSNNFNPQSHAFVLDQSHRDYMRLAAAALGLFLWAIVIVAFNGAAYGFSFSMDGKTTKKHYQQQQQPFLPHYHSQTKTKKERSIVAMTMTAPDDFQPTNNKEEDNKNDHGTGYISLAKNNVMSKPLPDFDFYKPKAASDDVWETFGYESNPTVFGQILRGELKTRILTETKRLLAFVDVKPRAPFHGLVIPKEHIRSVLELETEARLANDENFSSLELVHEISDVAHRLLQNHCPEAYRTGDYILCFHIPPFTSVDHLHLHVLAPASSMGPLYRYGKYNCEATNTSENNHYNVRWCIGLTTVLERMQGGLPPTPYSRSDSWGTIAYDALASVKSILLDRMGFGK